MRNTDDREPALARPEPDARTRPRWSRAVGLAASVVAVAAVGGFFWRRSKKRRVEEELAPLSHEWLAEHYYTTGQRGDED